MDIVETLFHPVISQWFKTHFKLPTEPQLLGWPNIAQRKHTLIAAPTGSGKTLSAFLVCIDQLFKSAIEQTLDDSVQIIYVSPLKALSNDIEKNLAKPLQEIIALAEERGYKPQEIRIGLRTGDTSSSKRVQMTKKPPHILVTTPESLYLMLTAMKMRKLLKTTHTVIIDEIHALVTNKRGSHLSLSLERLQNICPTKLCRIGLSATQNPITDVATFLVGSADVKGDKISCEIVNAARMRVLDLAVEVPKTNLGAICTHEQWEQIYSRLTELIAEHRSTLIFVNTRRLAERVSHRLRELIGEDQVWSHHGSMSKERRLQAESLLKAGNLKAIVATASLELGIDIGYIDLVCQISSPRSISAFLQRIGRAGHSIHALSKGRIFPLTRDELLECIALIGANKKAILDKIEIPEQPLDILCQQIVAEVSCNEMSVDDLLALIKRAWPYRHLSQKIFEQVIEIASKGITKTNKAGAYLHYDPINQIVRPRKSARLTALTCGGAIPDNADYRVVTEGDNNYVGTLDEDFAIESNRGDIFLLGNNSWQIIHVRANQVVVRDVHGAPPTIPFWRGEAPGRSFELSKELSDLRLQLADKIQISTKDDQVKCDSSLALQWLKQELDISDYAAAQAVEYVSAQKLAMRIIPSQQQIVFERFFDETGGMQLVVHAPFGIRINRAWGLALRKRFCRNFNFELQASADDNGFVLSMGTSQSFPIEQLFQFLNSKNAYHILIQALLAVPLFQIRWRWNLNRALCVLRNKAGKKVPAYLQRHLSDDLLTKVFPAQTQCLEHRTGDIEIPDHPLVGQTVFDCLTEAMDFKRWQEILKGIEGGTIKLIAVDTREASPFSHQLINSNPYAFLDGAPLEERRTRAVSMRRVLDVDELKDLAHLDDAAVTVVTQSALPLMRNKDELHEALSELCFMAKQDELQSWFGELVMENRAAAVRHQQLGELWIALEKWPIIKALYPDANISHDFVNHSELLNQDVSVEKALEELVRAKMLYSSPVTVAEFAQLHALRPEDVLQTFKKLELQGELISGRFIKNLDDVQWCERHLLARIHRTTIDGLRQQVKPVPQQDYLRFLVIHQKIAEDQQFFGIDGVLPCIELLQGYEAPCGIWERELIASRLVNYQEGMLNELTLSGKVIWCRDFLPNRNLANVRGSLLNKNTTILFAARADMNWVLAGEPKIDFDNLGSQALSIYKILESQGAMFYDELNSHAKLLSSSFEEGLSELIYKGLISCDGFYTLAPLINKNQHRLRARAHIGNKYLAPSRRKLADAGRYWLMKNKQSQAVDQKYVVEQWARQLLKRYGIVFRELLFRESLAPDWQSLAKVYRVMEARGQIYGGRFVEQVSGEQFALQDAVESLRAIRGKPKDNDWYIISAADPINLFGVINVREKIPARANNRLAIWNGELLASLQQGEIKFYLEVDPSLAEIIRRALRLNGIVRSHDPFVNEWKKIPTIKSFSEKTSANKLRNWQQ